MSHTPSDESSATGEVGAREPKLDIGSPHGSRVWFRGSGLFDLTNGKVQRKTNLAEPAREEQGLSMRMESFADDQILHNQSGTRFSKGSPRAEPAQVLDG